MAWFEAHQELPRHPKTRKAAKKLGIPIPHLVGHLWCLWGWALEMAEDGNLSKFDAEDIAIGAEWDDDPIEFVEALVSCGSAGGAGFLERGGTYGPPDDGLSGDLVLHDWWERAGKLVAKRRRDATRKRKERATTPSTVQRTSAGRPTDVPKDVQPDQSDVHPPSSDVRAEPVDGAAHTTRHDTTPPDQRTPDGGENATTATTDQDTDPGLPMRPADGSTYSRTLGEWAQANGHDPPVDARRSQLASWLIGVLQAELPANDRAQLATARDRARAVIADYLVDVTDTPMPRAAWSFLGRQIAERGASRVLDTVVIAVESGAGLTPPHDADPLALLKYATAAGRDQ